MNPVMRLSQLDIAIIRPVVGLLECPPSVNCYVDKMFVSMTCTPRGIITLIP